MLLLTLSLGTVAQENAWDIPPRTLPASVDVSEEMRESLLNIPPIMDVATARGAAPKTAEAWEAWAKGRDVSAAAATRAMAEELSVTIEEDKIAGVNVHRVTPSEIDEGHQKHLFVYIHGGAWVLNSGVAAAREAVLIAAIMKISVVSIDYRMPPKHPAPAAINDVVAVWQELLKRNSPASMAIGGSSAGGNISLGSAHRFKDEGLPLPGALYLGTPCVDIDLTGDSRFINEGVDRWLVSWEGMPLEAGKMYAGEFDHKHPHISPIYGDFSGFPPTYIISGTRDLLLSDAVRVHRKLRRAGVEADLHIYEGQSHGDYGFVLNAPETAEHCAELNAFLLDHLSNPLVTEPILSDDEARDIKMPKPFVE
jgi:acetyl esterase/lipase